MKLEVNREMDGQGQHEWRWLIAAYLFLGGLGSGAYIVGAIAGLTLPSAEMLARYAEAGVVHPALAMVKIGTTLGWLLVGIGTIFLMLDLGQKGNAPKVIARPQESWISRGAIIITLFLGWSFLHWLGTLAGFAVSGKAMAFVFALVGGFLALGTMLYTGALLGGSKAIALWRVGILPILFMLSALMTGLLIVMLVMVVYPGGEMVAEVFKVLSLIAAMLIVADAAAVFFFLNAAFGNPDAKEGAVRMLKDPKFLYVDLLGGLVAPLVLMLLVFLALKGGAAIAVTLIACLCGLAGGLMLRYSILAHGYMVTLNVAGFQCRRSPMTMAKVDKGLLPPS